MLLIILVLLLVVIFLIRSTIVGKEENKSTSSVYFRILINHIQLVLLTAAFNFEWPSKA